MCGEELWGGELGQLVAEEMTWWCGNGYCVGVVVVMDENRWRKPCLALGWRDDDDVFGVVPLLEASLWRLSPSPSISR